MRFWVDNEQFGTICPVMHHKQFQVRDIVDNKFLEFVGKAMPGLLVRTITNVGYQGAALFPPDIGVDPFGLDQGLNIINKVDFS